MDPHPEAIGDDLDEIGWPCRWIGFEVIAHEGDHLVGELVCTTRPGAGGNEPGQPAGIERSGRLVERGAGQAEGGGSATHGVALDSDPANHLVLDLDQIPGVEEVRGREAVVGDRFRVGVQASLGTQCPHLRILPAFRHGDLPNHMNVSIIMPTI